MYQSEETTSILDRVLRLKHNIHNNGGQYLYCNTGYQLPNNVIDDTQNPTHMAVTYDEYINQYWRNRFMDSIPCIYVACCYPNQYDLTVFSNSLDMVQDTYDVPKRLTVYNIDTATKTIIEYMNNILINKNLLVNLSTREVVNRQTLTNLTNAKSITNTIFTYI